MRWMRLDNYGTCEYEKCMRDRIVQIPRTVNLHTSTERDCDDWIWRGRSWIQIPCIIARPGAGRRAFAWGHWICGDSSEAGTSEEWACAHPPPIKFQTQTGIKARFCLVPSSECAPRDS